MREYATAQLAREASRYASLIRAYDLLHDVELPAEAQVGNYDVHCYWAGISVDVRVALDNNLPYRERIKPIGEVLRAFKAHSIRREVTEGTVYFYATGDVAGNKMDLTITCNTGAVSPACTVETITEEVTETRTVTRVVVTCPDKQDAMVAAYD